jgi:sulfatase modifying factor 1
MPAEPVRRRPFRSPVRSLPSRSTTTADYPYAAGAPGRYRQRTAPVGSLPPNPWGLYEMHGNVWEWCADWYADYPQEPQIDPRGPAFGKMRVLRGGTWSDPARYARSATRSRIEPVYRPRSTGFRIVLGSIGQS